VKTVQALKFLPSLPIGQALPDLLRIAKEDRAALRATVASKNPDQDRVMLRYADDVSKIYGETVIPWDLACALTSVLAGKDRGRGQRAFACRNEQSSLRQPVEFRTAVERAYGALLALDVSAPKARVVAGGLLKVGGFICADRPLVRPIPPAFPPPANR